jgi:hypothetical protein
MKGPALLPSHLAVYEACITDRELFQALIQHLDDLFLFFEAACEEETWVLQHSLFMRLVLRWIARQFYLGNLFLYDARRLVKIIQHHYSLLEPFLFFRSAFFFTIKLRVENQAILVNSLLFGVGSPVLASIFKRECFEKLNDEWTLQHVTLKTFQLMATYLYRGENLDLWQYHDLDILSLMAQAQAWEIPLLVKECALELRRYIHPDNVVEIILQAHQQGFEAWKEQAFAFFNEQGWGFQFRTGTATELKIEFLHFQPETLELFHLFAPWVTHLIFRGRLSEESGYAASLSLCPDLIGVDLSESHAYANQFAALPPYLQDLALSGCSWVRAHHLRQVAIQCPSIRKLELANYRHVRVWEELHHLKQLKELSLAHCPELTDEDLKIIGQACPLLVALDLQGCHKLDDQGIAYLVGVCRYLQELNLSDCNRLSDRSLKEIGLHLSNLKSLKLVECQELTDSGLLQLIKLRPTLTSLDVQGCSFSLKFLEYIRKNFPLLEVKESFL